MLTSCKVEHQLTGQFWTESKRNLWGSWVVEGLVVLVGFLLGDGLVGWRMFFGGWGLWFNLVGVAHGSVGLV